MLIRPAGSIRGEITLPGDKSISHRASIIAAMAEGETKIDNFATSADCASTLACLRQLGVPVRRDGTTAWIDGVGKSGFRPPASPLDCGNSGTTMRLLCGVLAGQPFDSTLTGDESLSRRPMNRVIEPVMRMGASVDSDEGRAPLTIHGKVPLRAIDYELRVASAQIKSCVLFAGLNAFGDTTVVEPVATRDHTERMLRWFGADVSETAVAGGKKIAVSGDSRLTAADIVVPADISSAAFFLIAAVCLKGSDVCIPNVGINPTRAGIVEILSKLGAGIRMSDKREQNNEPVADLQVVGRSAAAYDPLINGDMIANVIDELPILAVLGTQLEKGIEIRDASELRVKETDRIAAVVENLQRMGAAVEEFEDGFRIGKSNLKGARVDSFGDHRIAMAFAVAGLLSVEGDTQITGAEAVDVSFPGFFETLENAVIYE